MRPVRTEPSRAEEIELEQHIVRLEDEDLPQTDRSDLVEAMLDAAAREPRANLIVTRASERHVVQRPGRPRPYVAVVVARAFDAVDVHDGAAGAIVHPASILVGERRRTVARLEG